MDRDKSPVDLCIVQVTKAIFCCDILASWGSAPLCQVFLSQHLGLLGCSFLGRLGPGPGKPMRVRFLFQRLCVAYKKHIACLAMPTIPDPEPPCPCP